MNRRTRLLLALLALLAGVALCAAIVVNLYEDPARVTRLGGATLLCLMLLYVAWILVVHQDPPEPPKGKDGPA